MNIKANQCEIWIADYESGIDPDDDNVDVHVMLDSGKRHIATFFTIGNIQRLMESFEATGECAGGRYFWAANMLIVRRLTPEIIRDTVETLITSGEFAEVFSGPLLDE